MATFGALRHPWHPLLHPYRTHDLCPPDLCRERSAAYLKVRSRCLLSMPRLTGAPQRRRTQFSPLIPT